MVDVHYTQQRIAEVCKNISEDFKLADFYQDRYQGNDDKELRGFRQESEPLKNAIALAEKLSTLDQSLFLLLSPKLLVSLEQSCRSLRSAMQGMRDLYQETPHKRRRAIEVDKFEAIETEVETAQKKLKLREDNANLVTAFFESYEPFVRAASELLSYDDRQRLAKETASLKTQIELLRVQDAISPHRLMYEDYETSHMCAANVWLGLGIALLAFTVWYSHANVYVEIKGLIEKKMEWPNIFSLTILNLFALGLLSTAVFWAFKYYRLNKHNELVNRNKSATLKSFHSFSEATKGNSEAHSLILHKMTDAIFDIHEFGYLKEDSVTQGLPANDLINTLIQLKRTGTVS